MLKAALEDKSGNARYGYLAPFRNQAKQVAWDYVKEFTDPIPGRQWNESELRCDLPNGNRIQLFGADNYDAMRGMYFDGIILDEYAQMSPAAWQTVIRPALADRQGWAIFIGTPMGRNAFWEVYDQAKKDDEWGAWMFRASETNILPDSELKAAAKEMSDAQYRQEFECSFDAAILGSVYGPQIEEAENDGRISSVPMESGHPVYVAMDLGWNDSTTLWFFQTVGREVRVIDYYENRQEKLEHYASHMKALPYEYGTVFLPHDADQSELQTGATRADTFRNFGFSIQVLERQKDVMAGIEQTRNMFNRVWFDRRKTEKGVEALRQYRFVYDDKLRTFKLKPLHDWTSHAADGFRYLAQALPEAQHTGTAETVDIDYSWVA